MITQTKPEVHIYWQAVIEWCCEKKYGQISIVFQDGLPMKFNIPDGIGMKSILVKDVLKEYYKK